MQCEFKEFFVCLFKISTVMQNKYLPNIIYLVAVHTQETGIVRRTLKNRYGFVSDSGWHD